MQCIRSLADGAGRVSVRFHDESDSSVRRRLSPGHDWIMPRRLLSYGIAVAWLSAAHPAECHEWPDAPTVRWASTFPPAPPILSHSRRVQHEQRERGSTPAPGLCAGPVPAWLLSFCKVSISVCDKLTPFFGALPFPVEISLA